MSQPSHLVICVGNEGAEDLQILKLYRRLPDEAAESKGFLRVIDDSGEDYLYPESSFLPLPLPRPLEQQLESLAEERSRAEIA
jgi:hypothetical protein